MKNQWFSMFTRFKSFTFLPRHKRLANDEEFLSSSSSLVPWYNEIYFKSLLLSLLSEVKKKSNHFFHIRQDYDDDDSRKVWQQFTVEYWVMISHGIFFFVRLFQKHSPIARYTNENLMPNIKWTKFQSGIIKHTQRETQNRWSSSSIPEWDGHYWCVLCRCYYSGKKDFQF